MCTQILFNQTNIPFFNNTALKRYLTTHAMKNLQSLTFRSCSVESKCKEILTPN